MLRRRLDDPDEIRAALDRADGISLLLCREGDLSPAARALVTRAREAGVSIVIESEREMRRMSGGDEVRELVALAGPAPPTSLDALMSAEGLVLLLVGLRYPGNVGFILRAAEVAGAAGVVLSNDWGRPQLDEALRVGMRADRFMPVLESDAETTLASARRSGRRLVALETSGRAAPWQSDLRPSTVVVVGSETTGLPEALLASMDEVLCVPTRGFIPSYNVQAVVGMMLGEWLRQNAGAG